jgi:hypothetical protein
MIVTASSEAGSHTESSDPKELARYEFLEARPTDRFD